jgi:hypothetical protein
MPRQPLYVDYLPEDAQRSDRPGAPLDRAGAQAARAGRHALRRLCRHLRRRPGAAGPRVRTARGARQRAGGREGARKARPNALVSNTKLDDFRMILTQTTIRRRRQGGAVGAELALLHARRRPGAHAVTQCKEEQWLTSELHQRRMARRQRRRNWSRSTRPPAARPGPATNRRRRRRTAPCRPRATPSKPGPAPAGRAHRHLHRFRDLLKEHAEELAPSSPRKSASRCGKRAPK